MLVLTKPLGSGAVTTALKKGLADESILAGAVEVMTELNAAGAHAARAAGAHGMTDVTGFGLLGHLHELALASGVSAVVDAAAVPAIDGVLRLLEDDRALAGGSRNNRLYAEEFASFDAGCGRGTPAARDRRDDVRWTARRGRSVACDRGTRSRDRPARRRSGRRDRRRLSVYPG